MTTPKEDKPVYIPATLEDVARGILDIRKALDKSEAPKKPEYMFPALQGLPEEFRRLAAEARAKREESEGLANYYIWDARGLAWDEAAQMLEEKLNG